MVKLGSKVKDLITGIEGVATSRTEYMYGCARVWVVPSKLTKEGKPHEPLILDEQRVKVVKPNAKYKPKGFKYELGNVIKDVHTGFEGLVHSRTESLYQTTTYTIEPTKRKPDGDLIDMVGFPEERVELVTAQAPPVSKDSSAKSGGPQREASRVR